MATTNPTPSPTDRTAARPASTRPSARAAAAASRRSERARGGGSSYGPLLTVLTWVITLLVFVPVGWMVLTSFHSEVDAATNPPSLLAPLTLDQYGLLWERGLVGPMLNSAMASVFSTLFVLALAIPAAYALTINRVEKWKDVMFFFLSTKMLPLIAALLPIYLIVQYLGLLDNIWALVILYTSMNLPIAVWMMRSFLQEVPREIIEAAQVDGAKLFTILFRIIGPVAVPGIAATALICFIFSWNEFLFALNLTATQAGTAPVFLVGFISNEGLFLARLCAASVLVSLPVVIAGFAAQDKLVQGLSLGAVK
jgi:sorbitol/mannitol transport system permease protein